MHVVPFPPHFVLLLDSEGNACCGMIASPKRFRALSQLFGLSVIFVEHRVEPAAEAIQAAEAVQAEAVRYLHFDFVAPICLAYTPHLSCDAPIVLASVDIVVMVPCFDERGFVREDNAKEVVAGV